MTCVPALSEATNAVTGADETPPTLAVTTAESTELPATTLPSDPKVTTLLDAVQVMTASLTVAPLASTARAASCVVPPGCSRMEEGVTMTCATVWLVGGGVIAPPSDVPLPPQPVMSAE